MSDMPVKKNVARTFYIPGVVSQANKADFQTAPTIAAGDFQYSIDGGAWTNLTNLPDVYPAGGTQIRLQPIQAELNGNQINIRWRDQAGNEWCSGGLMIFTSSIQMGDISAAVWDRLTSAITTTGSVGKLIKDNLDMVMSLIYARIGAPFGASLSADISAVNAKTANLPSDPADQSLLTADILGVYNRIGAPAGPSIADDIAAISGDIVVNTSVAISATTAQRVASGNMAIEAGYTLQQTITSTITDDLASATKLWMAFKQFRTLDDSQSFVLLEKTDGLTIVNATPNYPTPTDGAMVVSGSAGNWQVAITVKYSATALLFDKNLDGCFVGIKAKIGTKEVPVWECSDAAVFDGIVRSN